MSYLKLKLQADRTIALNFEKALAQLREETRTASTTVASGIERASWYSSCVFDDYKDVCKRLRSEDVRMFSALPQVFSRHDVILDMVEIYFRKNLRVSVNIMFKIWCANLLKRRLIIQAVKLQNSPFHFLSRA